MNYSVQKHPLLNEILFTSRFNAPIGSLEFPQHINTMLQLKTEIPVSADDSIRFAIRELLRSGGYKPAGRGKPSSEYLLNVSRENTPPQINLAVDIGNIVSLYSGVPISVLDLSKIKEPVYIKIAPKNENYVFNQSGQIIDLAGLLCLYDAEGPCANAVKDSQRTKTDFNTTETLTVIWGSVAIKKQIHLLIDWYLELLKMSGAQVKLASAEHYIEVIE